MTRLATIKANLLARKVQPPTTTALSARILIKEILQVGVVQIQVLMRLLPLVAIALAHAPLSGVEVGMSHESVMNRRVSAVIVTRSTLDGFEIAVDLAAANTEEEVAKEGADAVAVQAEAEATTADTSEGTSEEEKVQPISPGSRD